MKQLKKGMYLLVKTKTFNDVFGKVLYEIVEDSLPSPEKDRNENDGVKCLIVSGTGPAARKGYPIMDSEVTILRNVKEGITAIMSQEKGRLMASTMSQQADPIKQARTGVIEMD